jgi:hypothetical protein
LDVTLYVPSKSTFARASEKEKTVRIDSSQIAILPAFTLVPLHHLKAMRAITYVFAYVEKTRLWAMFLVCLSGDQMRTNTIANKAVTSATDGIEIPPGCGLSTWLAIPRFDTLRERLLR